MSRRLWASIFLLSAPGVSEILRFRAEWRGVDAGFATMETDGRASKLTLETAGFARVLYPVNDVYRSGRDDRGCTVSSLMKTEEGRSRGETRISYGASVHVTIQDLRAGQEQRREFAGTECVHDVLAALLKLRSNRLEPGKSVDFAIANERKFAQVRVEALGRESIKTPAGERKAIRHEVHMLNGVLYRRKGRLFLWVADDESRTPLRIRVQMPFYLGTVTLELENRT